ncbi:MAG: hypothetical protein CL693_06650 [Cellvibrionaceae bacterium]|nr:hypothetical protein [Cellvibrionaceae bacterium]
MGARKMKVLLRSWVCCCALWMAFPAGAVDGASIEPLGLKKVKHPAPNLWVSGQPTKVQLAQLEAAGIQHVINLRPDNENSWAEAPLVKALGMRYHHLPIAGGAGVSFNNAGSLKTLIQSLNGEPVLIHCASGNRVGGLIALQAISEGVAEQQAIDKGKEWGLTRLEKHVRHVAAESASCEQATC